MNRAGSSRRAHVLLVAPACDGNDVGESWLAHQWAQLLSRAVPGDAPVHVEEGPRAAVAAAPGRAGRRVAGAAARAPRGAAEQPAPAGLRAVLRAGPALGPRAASRRANGSTSRTRRRPWRCATRHPSSASGIPLVVGPVGRQPGVPARVRRQEEVVALVPAAARGWTGCGCGTTRSCAPPTSRRLRGGHRPLRAGGPRRPAAAPVRDAPRGGPRRRPARDRPHGAAPARCGCCTSGGWCGPRAPAT